MKLFSNVAAKFALMAATCSLAFALDVPSNRVVDVEWLKANLADQDLVLIDLREDEAAYKKDHIKGAVRWAESDFREPRFENPGYIGSPTAVERLFKNSGITDKSAIVFYNSAKEATDYTLSTLAVYVAEYYGLTNTAVLNGGYDAWVKAGNEVVADVPTPNKSDFEISKMDLSVVATAYDMDKAVELKDAELIDARNDAQFSGEAMHKKAAKAGHLEDAKHLFIAKLATLNDGIYYINTDKAAVDGIFNEAGIKADVPQIWYCNTGWFASGGWFVSKFISGAKDVKSYEASMVEYTKLPKRKMVKANE